MSIAFEAVRSCETFHTDFLPSSVDQTTPFQQFPLLGELRIVANARGRWVLDQIVEEVEVDGRLRLISYEPMLLSWTDDGHWRSIRPEGSGNLLKICFSTPGMRSQHFTNLLHEIRQVDLGSANPNSFTSLRTFIAPYRELRPEDLARLLSLCPNLETLSVDLQQDSAASDDLDRLLSWRGAGLRDVTIHGAKLRWLLSLFRCQRLEIACRIGHEDVTEIKKTLIHTTIKGSKSEVKYLQYLKIVFDRKAPIICSTLVADLLASITSPTTKLVLDSRNIDNTSSLALKNVNNALIVAQWICDIQGALEYRRELREALKSAEENNGRGYRKILPTPQQRRETRIYESSAVRDDGRVDHDHWS